jgi:hypothetical protein
MLLKIKELHICPFMSDMALLVFKFNEIIINKNWIGNMGSLQQTIN